MGRFALPFGVAVLGGAALFAALLVPVLVVQYRRYGRLSGRRILAVSAVCVYAVALVAYTFLPLPSSPDNCTASGGARLQLVPFRFVTDIVSETKGLGPVRTLTSTVTLQVVFNVVLFVPFGLLVRRFGGQSLVVTTALAFLVTLAVETTQGTALWGLYACPYRVADVDDLMANTFGGFLGALLAPRFLAWLPMPTQLAHRRLQPTKVTAVRRWLGMLVDLTVFAGLSAVVAFTILAGTQVTGDSLQLVLGTVTPAVPAVVAGLITFALPALRGSGASIGQRLVWLRPQWPSPPTVAQRILVASVGLSFALSFALGAIVDPEGPLQVVALVLGVPALLSPPSVLFTRGHRGLSLSLARAELTDSRSSTTTGEPPPI